MKNTAYYSLSFLSVLTLLGCNSSSDSKEENNPPSINEVVYEIDYQLNDNKALSLNVVGTMHATDEDGSIVGFNWSVISGQDISLQDANTQTVSFDVPLLNSETPNLVIIEAKVVDDEGAESVMTTFEQDINAYLAIYLWNQEVKVGELTEISANIYGRESLLSELNWSVTSGQNITLLDAHSKTVSFIAPDNIENNIIALQLEYTDTHGNIRYAETEVTVVP